MKILITGGAGYIGSHTCIHLLQADHEVTVVDNLSNSSLESLQRVRRLTNKSVTFYETDLLDRAALGKVFGGHEFDAVIHFAGLKSVGESVRHPLDYYRNNLTGTLNLCESMASHKVKKLVFSSSATVYGDNPNVPFTEQTPTGKPANPYGRTKLAIEQLLEDLQAADHEWQIVRLRYFNPVGAHESGHIGEHPKGTPNNLLPFITQVAVGKLDQLVVFGNDYDTPDGTGIRDYIHVVDLAQGHLAAIGKLTSNPGLVTYNLGTGRGVSVLELIRTFEQVTGTSIPFRVGPRRDGDIAASYTDPTLAESELGWRALKSIEEICEDAWRFQQQNPHGY